MRVIVIAAHGWHAGWLGCYGNEWISTTHLDHLASEGVVFDQHFADAPSIVGAIRSWKTGQYHSLAGPDLFQTLSENGIACVGLRDVCVKDRPTVSHDWDILIETDEDIDLCSGVETFLEGVDPEFPCLLWAETDQLLPPWIIDPELFAEIAGPSVPENETSSPWANPPLGAFGKDITQWERLRHSYAAAVTAFDEQIGAICESINTHSANASTLLIVTAGWGFPLGEHGFVGPGLPQLHEESVHVPLILRFPEAAHAGRRISAFSQNVDLLPTILNAFSMRICPKRAGMIDRSFTPHAPREEIPHAEREEYTAEVQGRSLLPLIARTTTTIRPYAFMHQESSSAIRTPEWAALRWATQDSEPLAQLFRKPHDRWEVNDLRQHHPAWAEYLEQTLQTLEIAIQSAKPLEFPALKEYTDIVNEASSPQETIDEHRSSGGREHDESKSEGDLRGHQSDEED